MSIIKEKLYQMALNRQGRLFIETVAIGQRDWIQVNETDFLSAGVS